VVLTVSADAAYDIGSPNNATITIADNDQGPPPQKPTVTIVATDANASEQGPDTGAFTLSRDGSTASALTVQYSLGGSAANGIDYQSLPTSVTIPQGAASAAITVTPIDDNEVEGDETIVLTLSANAAYTVGSPGSATITIHDNDSTPPPPPTADFTANPTSGNAPLAVQFTDRSSGSITSRDWNFGDGSSHSSTQNPSHTYNNAGDYTVTLTVTGSGGSDSKSVTIHVTAPPPPPTVTVLATDFLASEPGTDTGTFTISRTGDTSTPLTVNYSLGGTAQNGTDYQQLATTVTIPVGASSVDVVVRPIDDQLIEVAELVILTLSPDTAYNVGLLNTATITIVDNDLLLLEENSGSGSER